MKEKLTPEEEKMWEDIREESAGMNVMEMMKIEENMDEITKLVQETKTIIQSSSNRKFWNNVENKLEQILKIINS